MTNADDLNEKKNLRVKSKLIDDFGKSILNETLEAKDKSFD